MRAIRFVLVAVFAGITVFTARPGASPQTPAPPTPASVRTIKGGQVTAAPTIAQFLSAASPIEVVSAHNVDRVAWIAYDDGVRNVYTAAAPLFAPVKLSAFTKDDGVEMTGLDISADGSTVTFVRGTVPNREGWSANPSADPDGTDETIWAARTATPGIAWRVVEGGGNTQLAPDGSRLLYVRDGQIYGPRISQTPGMNEVDRGEKHYIREWGANSAPVYSPDGRKIAFVTSRTDHAFIAVMDVATRAVTYMAPDVDRDSNPMWSADSKQITFIRRPGAAFGQQSHPGSGGLGLPAGPLYQAPANGAAGAGRNGGGGGGRNGGGGANAGGQFGGGGGGGGNANPNVPDSARAVPGLTTSTLKGGYTFAFMKADVATAEAKEIWHTEPNQDPPNTPNMRLAGHYLVFSGTGAGGGRGGGRGGGGGNRGGGQTGPVDEWDRWSSLDLSNPSSKPVVLTTTNGIIEDAATDVAISPDGKTFYYCSNDGDIERRHIYAVPVSGGTPKRVTTGDGIETYPAPLASNSFLATLSATWKMPNSLGIWTLTSTRNEQKIVFPTSRPGFPMDAHVEPQLVLTTAPDGFVSHDQLFLPKDIKAGEKRPAMIFVHGGPVREMLLGYHYRYVYHMFYGINQWLVSKGYVVLSVNYRGGVGYGRTFQGMPSTNIRGNSEYPDVVAAAKYLQGRPDVDANRIGIYGLSYGGLLTAQALARNSDIFKLGIDYAGVHLYGSSLDPNEVSYKSSAISAIDTWKSPVLLIQGDDDRNVYFAQTVGLVQLLRARNIYYELIVQPDDVHDSLRHDRWVYWVERMDKFLDKFFGKP